MRSYDAAKLLHEARMADKDAWLTAAIREAARKYIDKHRIRDPHNRLRTLDGRSVPPKWKAPRVEYHDPYDGLGWT